MSQQKSQPSPKSLPDLRYDHQEFTLEHCSVLLERIAKLFESVHDVEFGELTDTIDPDSIREFLLELLSPQELSEIFQTEIGKGFLMGMFIKRLVELQESEDV